MFLSPNQVVIYNSQFGPSLSVSDFSGELSPVYKLLGSGIVIRGRTEKKLSILN